MRGRPTNDAMILTRRMAENRAAKERNKKRRIRGGDKLVASLPSRSIKGMTKRPRPANTMPFILNGPAPRKRKRL